MITWLLRACEQSSEHFSLRHGKSEKFYFIFLYIYKYMLYKRAKLNQIQWKRFASTAVA